MRPARQVKVISLQLVHLEYFKEQLEDLIIEMEKILTKGRSWIEETDKIHNFSQMRQFLARETLKCTGKCTAIAKDKDTSQLSSTMEDELSGSLMTKCNINDNFKDEVKTKLAEIDKLMTEHSTELRDLKQKLKRQEKKNDVISSQWTEIQNETDEKFDDVMKELHSASDYMADLKSQTEILTDEKNKYENKMDELILELKNQQEQMNSVIKSQQSNIEKLQAVKEDIESKINILVESVQPMKNDIETVSSDLVCFIKSHDKMLEAHNVENNVFQKQFELLLDMLSRKLDVFLNGNTNLKDKFNKKVAFTAGLTKRTIVPSGIIIIYDKVITNIGDCYNNATGIFTCPMDGLYLFHVSLTATKYVRALLGIYKNAYTGPIMVVYSPSEDDAGINSNMVTIQLKQNDEIFLQSILFEDCHLYGHESGTYNSFTGFILSAD